MLEDFYYSKSQFDSLLEKESEDGKAGIVTEVWIHGKWNVYTESVPMNQEPQNEPHDLEYLGRAPHDSDSRYRKTTVTDWIDEKALDAIGEL